MLLPLLLLACTKATPPVTAPVAPAEAPTPAAPYGPVTLQGDTGPVSVTPVYHGTVLIEAANLRIWVDPWQKAKLDGPPADVVLLTDLHPDHLDAAALERVLGPNTVIVAPPAVVAAYPQHPVGVVLKNGERATVKGVSVEAVPMYNLSRGPEAGKRFHDPGRGNGYLLTLDGRRVYLAGDTECTPEMKALTGVDLALLPMNLPYTMPPEEAAACVAAFLPKQVTPYHYAGSDLSAFTAALSGVSGVQITLRDAYPGGLPF